MKKTPGRTSKAESTGRPEPERREPRRGAGRLRGGSLTGIASPTRVPPLGSGERRGSSGDAPPEGGVCAPATGGATRSATTVAARRDRMYDSRRNYHEAPCRLGAILQSGGLHARHQFERAVLV